MMAQYMDPDISKCCGLRCSVGETAKDLWKLDLDTRQWRELEQYGTRPCARMAAHGVAI